MTDLRLDRHVRNQVEAILWKSTSFDVEEEAVEALLVATGTWSVKLFEKALFIVVLAKRTKVQARDLRLAWRMLSKRP